MKKLFLTIMVLCASVMAVSAQESKYEKYVGFQYVRVNPDVRNPNFKFDRTSDLNGANASITYYGNKYAGLTAELGANFDFNNARTGLYTVMGGVTLKANRSKTFQPFLRGLVGASVFRADDDNRLFPTKNNVGLAFATGAGLDVKIKNNFKLRLLQVDYLHTDNFNKPQHNIRIGAGIVF